MSRGNTSPEQSGTQVLGIEPWWTSAGVRFKEENLAYMLFPQNPQSVAGLWNSDDRRGAPPW